MSLADFHETAPLDALRARLDAAHQEIGRLRKTIAEQQARIDSLTRVADYAGRALRPPRWLTARTRKPEKAATLCAVLSDCHFDETVNPSEIGGRNAYDRRIAELRLERFFAQVVRLSRDYLTGMHFDGVVLMLAGDLISGEIHDELRETNEATTLDTVLHWSERLAAGIGMLADTFGRVHVPLVVGNHGRRTRKPRAKRRARDNYDWLIGQLLARHFDQDDRVTLDIPDGTDCLVRVHDTTLLLTHGDQVSGGGGIGGIWPPIMRMLARKRTRHAFDAVVMGHWHQLIMAPTAGVIVNGSLCGENEYAAIQGFTPEPPQQALFTIAPRHGVTFSCPVFVRHDAEGW